MTDYLRDLRAELRDLRADVIGDGRNPRPYPPRRRFLAVIPPVTSRRISSLRLTPSRSANISTSASTASGNLTGITGISPVGGRPRRRFSVVGFFVAMSAFIV